MPDITVGHNELKWEKVSELLQWLGTQLKEIRDLPNDMRGILTTEQINLLAREEHQSSVDRPQAAGNEVSDPQ